MSFFTNLKKGAKGYIKEYKKSSTDRKQYQDKLKLQVRDARREAYLEEAKKSARIKAKLDAQKRFNPTPQQSRPYSVPQALMDPIGFSSPKQKVIQQIQRKKSKKKKRKTLKQKVVTKIVYQQQPKTPKQNLNDRMKDIMNKLPQ